MVARTLLLTFDVEGFDLPQVLGRHIDDADALALGREGAVRLLAFCQSRPLLATCFVTARFAERCPELVRELGAAGCEIACHGPTHAGFRGASCGRRAEALCRARETIEGIAGAPVVGYRNPRFETVDPGELASAGFVYDSSVHPTWIPGRYNSLREPRLPRRGAQLVRIPVSVMPVFRAPLSFLWFRNAPSFLMHRLTQWILAAERVLCVYFHNWEFADLERVRQRFGLPWAVTRSTGEALAADLGIWLDRLARQGVVQQTMGQYAALHFGAWTEAG